MDGASIWAGDGIHLTSNASRVAARKLMADLAHGGLDDEPAANRTRLDSVIPVPAPARKKEAGKGTADAAAASTLPTAALAIRPAAADTARTRGWQPKPLHPGGGGPAWGIPRGSNHGAGRGNRGPLRGGQRGRWGRW